VYVNPFWAGVIATIFVECAALVIYGIANMKK
jgi:hypothetical protein